MSIFSKIFGESKKDKEKNLLGSMSKDQFLDWWIDHHIKKIENSNLKISVSIRWSIDKNCKEIFGFTFPREEIVSVIKRKGFNTDGCFINLCGYDCIEKDYGNHQ